MKTLYIAFGGPGVVCHDLKHLKTPKKSILFNLILAISADLETRLDSWAGQIRPPLGTLNIGVFWCGFRHYELKKKKRKKKKSI